MRHGDSLSEPGAQSAQQRGGARQMKARGAVLHSVPGGYEPVDVEFDDPGRNEVLVELAASGLCHTDLHYASGSSKVSTLPLLGGHEGAGIVRGVGPDTEGVSVG